MTYYLFYHFNNFYQLLGLVSLRFSRPQDADLRSQSQTPGDLPAISQLFLASNQLTKLPGSFCMASLQKRLGDTKRLWEEGLTWNIWNPTFNPDLLMLQAQKSPIVKITTHSVWLGSPCSGAHFFLWLCINHVYLGMFIYICITPIKITFGSFGDFWFKLWKLGICCSQALAAPSLESNNKGWGFGFLKKKKQHKLNGTWGHSERWCFFDVNEIFIITSDGKKYPIAIWVSQ